MGCSASASHAKAESASTSAASTMTVTPVLLDEDMGEIFRDGQILNVGEDGTLDMGDMDHVLGLSSRDIETLPSKVLGSLGEVPDMKFCTICQEEFKIGDHVRILPCSHVHHRECVDKWLQISSKCPTCKQIVPKPGS